MSGDEKFKNKKYARTDKVGENQTQGMFQAFLTYHEGKRKKKDRQKDRNLLGQQTQREKKNTRKISSSWIWRF